MKVGLRKDSTNSSALVLTAGFMYSGTFGFAGFGGTYIHRFFVAIFALTFLSDWPEFTLPSKV